MANNRGGLSKREYAAKLAGGTLNYKTGVISTKPKATTYKSAAQPSSQQQANYAPAGAVGTSANGGYIMADGSVKMPMSSATNQSAANYQPNYQPAEQIPMSSETDSRAANYRPKNNSSSSNKSSGSGYNYTPSVSYTTPAPTPVINGVSWQGTDGQGGGSVTSANPSLNSTYVQAPIDYAKQVADSMANWKFGINTAQTNSGANDYLLGGAPTDLLYPQQDNSIRVDPATGNDPTAPLQPKMDTNIWGQQTTDKTSYVDPVGNPVRNTNGSSQATGSRSTTGNGANTGNPYDAGMKYLQKNQKMIEKAFQNMLDNVSPTYQGYLSDYTASLNDTQNAEKQALLARQMSYGTADSEQRNQAEQRLASDFAGKRAEFMRQLADKQNEQLASIGLQRSTALSQGNTQMANNAIDAYKYQQAQAQQDFANALRLNSYNSSGTQNNDAAQAAWFDNQAQQWVNNGNAAFGREALTARGANKFGGEPSDYAKYFPNFWESNYQQTPPKLTYRTNELGQTEIYDQYGNRLQ